MSIFTNKATSTNKLLNEIANLMFGGSNGGVFVESGKGGISAAHVAAVGSGGTPGVTTFTVAQSGASGGSVSSTIGAGGELPAINTAVTVVTPGIKYSIADTLALTGGSLTGGTIHVTAIDMDEYDFIMVESGVIFTELKDANGVDLLTLKNLSGITFTSQMILNSGTNYKIKNMVYTGGNVFGFNI